MPAWCWAFQRPTIPPLHHCVAYSSHLMSRYSLSPERLFDRPWRSGHPFRPRCGRARRVMMMILLIILCMVIGGYNYVTDSERVRQMAESSLSGLIGGRVQVGGATLSIFEGLRLDDVKVYVDRAAP